MFLTGLLSADVSLAVYLYALKHESLEMARPCFRHAGLWRTPSRLWGLLALEGVKWSAGWHLENSNLN